MYRNELGSRSDSTKSGEARLPICGGVKWKLGRCRLGLQPRRARLRGPRRPFGRPDLHRLHPSIDQRRQGEGKRDRRHQRAEQRQLLIARARGERDAPQPRTGGVAEVEGALVERRGQVRRIGCSIHHPDLQPILRPFRVRETGRRNPTSVTIYKLTVEDLRAHG
jgi:hypothetical protein